ncbi:glycerol-3-phosphate responsive antiterminator [Lysinibacillus mangiferihumi]|uniref:Glycerol uptake operon antiterminator regulatory protein n=1 Tax=Lysinibacillus mangiferihumi TaxID=1130819 RepID=A0A4V5TM85_9BACI|nr:glycerol-3-phosphate responsive antiterminator [Lysinibacillus mangiferihumi]TKI70793.1 glycerol-3-phosphate responsive antiterminator [Lysinibacillus mangiferihumi]
MYKIFQDRLADKQLVAAIKEPKAIEAALKYKDNISAVILMMGDILNVKHYVQLFHDAGLPVILHVEKIGGLQLDQYGIDFVSKVVKPFAIVTTKANVIKRAKQQKIFVIQRIFLIDTEVYYQLEQSIHHTAADMIEIMPCRAPDFIHKLIQVTDKPIITGGLLDKIEYAEAALAHGANAVTTSNVKLWKKPINKR